MEIPCENCITMPICKAIFRRNRDRYMYGIFIVELCNKCSIIADLTKARTPNQSPNRIAIQKILNFFKNEYKKSLIIKGD
jgi:hypothetical protein